MGRSDLREKNDQRAGTEREGRGAITPPRETVVMATAAATQDRTASLIKKLINCLWIACVRVVVFLFLNHGFIPSSSLLFIFPFFLFDGRL